jgi:hypothetical protein
MTGFRFTDNTGRQAVSAPPHRHDKRPATGLTSPDEHSEPAEDGPGGGDPACWAHLVCPECGSVVSDGHRLGCGFEPVGLG